MEIKDIAIIEYRYCYEEDTFKHNIKGRFYIEYEKMKKKKLLNYKI
jgi:hypothetical protein